MSERIESLEDLLGLVMERWEVVLPEEDPSPIPLFSSLFHLSRQLQRFHDGVLKPHGRTLAEYQILSYLRAIGPASPSDLNRFLQQTPAGMTYTLDQLEKAELVGRRPSREDRRSVQIVLTRAGRREAERLMKAEGRAQGEITAEMSRRDLAAALQMLMRLSALLADRAERS